MYKCKNFRAILGHISYLLSLWHLQKYKEHQTRNFLLFMDCKSNQHGKMESHDHHPLRCPQKLIFKDIQAFDLIISLKILSRNHSESFHWELYGNFVDFQTFYFTNQTNFYHLTIFSIILKLSHWSASNYLKSPNTWYLCSSTRRSLQYWIYLMGNF